MHVHQLHAVKKVLLSDAHLWHLHFCLLQASQALLDLCFFLSSSFALSAAACCCACACAAAAACFDAALLPFFPLELCDCCFLPATELDEVESRAEPPADAIAAGRCGASLCLLFEWCCCCLGTRKEEEAVSLSPSSLESLPCFERAVAVVVGVSQPGSSSSEGRPYWLLVSMYWL